MSDTFIISEDHNYIIDCILTIFFYFSNCT